MKHRRGSRARHFYTLLVLFVTLLILGSAAYSYWWADLIGAEARQNLLYLAECQDEAGVQDILRLKAALESQPDFHTVEYISAARAATLLGEDELAAFGEEGELAGAIPSMLAIRFQARVYEEERQAALLEALRREPLLRSVYTQPELLDHLQRNLQTIGQGLAVAGVIILLLSLLLLSSIIKLSLYADRTEIKTMQLTGATPAYIRRPYIRRYLGLALLSALAVCICLAVLHLRITGHTLPGPENLRPLLLLGGGIAGLGVLITGLVTYRTVNKYIFADIETLF